jgi:hypothetical protein
VNKNKNAFSKIISTLVYTVGYDNSWVVWA